MDQVMDQRDGERDRGSLDLLLVASQITSVF